MQRILDIVSLFLAGRGAGAIPALPVSTPGASCGDDTMPPASDVAFL
jgi:hypothetical protein